MKPVSPRALIVLACLTPPLAAGCGSASHARAGAAGPSVTDGGAKLKVTTTPRFGAPPASAPVRSGVVQIAYRNITISPDVLRVRAGSTVVWTNNDPVEHNVTSRGGPARIASGTLGAGRTFAVKLTTPGVIHYLCTIHPATMNGTIEVVR
jgi:plastocyanin